MPMTEADRTVWAALFARTNMGMPMPQAHEVRNYRSNARHGASLAAMVNHVCAEFMETDEHYEMFLDEARSWDATLRNEDLEYVFKTWPDKKAVWDASEVSA